MDAVSKADPAPMHPFEVRIASLHAFAKEYAFTRLWAQFHIGAGELKLSK